MDFLASNYFAWRLQVLVYKKKASKQERMSCVKLFDSSLSPLTLLAMTWQLVEDIVPLKTKASICSNAGI